VILMNKNNLVRPILHWAGGKRQLLGELSLLLPKEIEVYCEPFVGGGALFFNLQPNIAYINDINNDLICFYKVLKDDFDAFIFALQEYKELIQKCEDESVFFYNIRNLDRDKELYNSLSSVQKAARLFYLNRKCYNGLFRVNSNGEFNAPFNRKHVCFINENIIQCLRAVHEYLNTANVYMTSCDFEEVLKTIPKNTFVYLDPPYYVPVKKCGFTKYSKDGFNEQDHIRLRKCCDYLTTNGIKFMLSNSDTDFIREQYSDYNIVVVKAKRSINSNSKGRGFVNELIIRNYNELRKDITYNLFNIN